MKDIEIIVNKETGFVSNASSYLIQQENLQRKIIFKFKEGFVDGNAYLCIEKDSQKGKIQLTKNNEQYETIIKSNIVNNTKSINLSLKIYEAENEDEEIPIFVSKIVTLKVAESLVIDDDLPEDLPTWQELVNGEISQLELAVENLDNTKQDNLVSGSTIKTINNQSILGEGNISVTAEEVNYNNILNKPQINNVTLSGNKSLNDLGIQPAGNYVLQEIGKGLSTNDYTTAEKNKLAVLNNYNDTEIKSDISNLQTNKADKTEIPDVSNFITNTVDDLTNYYKKSETYTQTQINSLISAITTINILVVQTLPTQNISTTTIYLVPRTTTEINNIYDEYIYVSNSWEKIGSTDIDLSGYQTLIDSTHKLNADLVDDTNSNNKFVTTSEKNTWNNKSDFSGNYNDLTNKPTNISSFTNDVGYLTEHQDISGKEDKTNKTTTIDNESTNTQYSSAKAVYDYVEGLNTYSTDEVRIGTYMDKPLYRKIIIVNNPPKDTENSLFFSSLSIEKITSIGGMAYDSTAQSFPVNFFGSTNAYIYTHADYDNSRLKYRNANWTLLKIEFILEYTKTTD